MRHAALLLTMTGLMLGCSGRVEQARYDAIQRQVTDLAAQLKDAQTKLASCAQTAKPQYQMQSDGSALIRLNTVTGETCVVNTPRAMQSTSADFIHQTCDWRDAVEHGSTVPDADCTYVPGVCNFKLKQGKK
jgi:hypothetical protein